MKKEHTNSNRRHQGAVVDHPDRDDGRAGAQAEPVGGMGQTTRQLGALGIGLLAILATATVGKAFVKGGGD